jgi:hypothetical protein
MVGILIFSGSAMSSAKIFVCSPYAAEVWDADTLFAGDMEKDCASDGTRPRYKQAKVVFGAEEYRAAAACGAYCRRCIDKLN